jgi:hypothetical protein
MTRYVLDTDGVTRARLTLADDPAQLRECASVVAATTAAAMSAVGPEGSYVRTALERFRMVHCRALDAVADAASALGDRLDQSTVEARSVELFVTTALAEAATELPAGMSGSSDAGSP